MTLALPQLTPFNSTTVRNIKQTLIGLSTRAGMRIAAQVAPHWTVRQASRLFITPPRFTQPAAERALLNKGIRHDIPTTAGCIAAWQFGDENAPAIIASHGWGGRGAQFRAFVPALVAAGWQVWLFDHVGHGQSEGSEAALMDFALGMAGVHAHLRTRGITVQGAISHSLGGAAVAAAMRGFSSTQGIAIPRVVMIAPPSSLTRYSRIFARHLGIPERIRAAMQWRFEQRYGVSWNDFEMPQAVAELKSKALVIHDQGDHDVPVSAGFAVARAWPDARFVRTSGLGHRRILKDDSVIADCVDFLADRVHFSRPAVIDEWQDFPGPAPLF